MANDGRVYILKGQNPVEIALLFSGGFLDSLAFSGNDETRNPVNAIYSHLAHGEPGRRYTPGHEISRSVPTGLGGHDISNPNRDCYEVTSRRETPGYSEVKLACVNATKPGYRNRSMWTINYSGGPLDGVSFGNNNEHPEIIGPWGRLNLLTRHMKPGIAVGHTYTGHVSFMEDDSQYRTPSLCRYVLLETIEDTISITLTMEHFPATERMTMAYPESA